MKAVSPWQACGYRLLWYTSKIDSRRDVASSMMAPRGETTSSQKAGTKVANDRRTADLTSRRHHACAVLGGQRGRELDKESILVCQRHVAEIDDALRHIGGQDSGGGAPRRRWRRARHSARHLNARDVGTPTGDMGSLHRLIALVVAGVVNVLDVLNVASNERRLSASGTRPMMAFPWLMCRYRRL